MDVDVEEVDPNPEQPAGPDPVDLIARFNSLRIAVIDSIRVLSEAIGHSEPLPAPASNPLSTQEILTSSLAYDPRPTNADVANAVQSTQERPNVAHDPRPANAVAVHAAIEDRQSTTASADSDATIGNLASQPIESTAGTDSDATVRNLVSQPIDAPPLYFDMTSTSSTQTSSNSASTTTQPSSSATNLSSQPTGTPSSDPNMSSTSSTQTSGSGTTANLITRRSSGAQPPGIDTSTNTGPTPRWSSLPNNVRNFLNVRSLTDHFIEAITKFRSEIHPEHVGPTLDHRLRSRE
jgi:hypothetical protein